MGREGLLYVLYRQRGLDTSSTCLDLSFQGAIDNGLMGLPHANNCHSGQQIRDTYEERCLDVPNDSHVEH